MTIKTASPMPIRRLKRLSPWILVALGFLLALSLSIDAVRRDSTRVAAAPPPAPDSSRASSSSLKTIAVPLAAAEQPAVKVRDAAALKEIPPAAGRLQRTRFGQEGPLVKMVPQENVFGDPLVKGVPQEKIVGEPLAALGPELRPARANPDPNSVFSWGPWSQTTSLARVDNGRVENDAGQQGLVRTAIVTQARQDSAGPRPAGEGVLPPGVISPPGVIPPTGGLPGGLTGKGDRPGWGHGDKNHSHHHKHHHQHQQHGRRDR